MLGGEQQQQQQQQYLKKPAVAPVVPVFQQAQPKPAPMQGGKNALLVSQLVFSANLAKEENQKYLKISEFLIMVLFYYIIVNYICRLESWQPKKKQPLRHLHQQQPHQNRKTCCWLLMLLLPRKILPHRTIPK
jgi:hypothetical protein